MFLPLQLVLLRAAQISTTMMATTLVRIVSSCYTLGSTSLLVRALVIPSPGDLYNSKSGVSSNDASCSSCRTVPISTTAWQGIRARGQYHRSRRHRLLRGVAMTSSSTPPSSSSASAAAGATSASLLSPGATCNAALAARDPPRTVQGTREFETFFGSYRVRPKRKSESFADANGQCILVFSGGDTDTDEENDVTDDESMGESRQYQESSQSVEDNILVVEDLRPGGGYVAFCGAVTPQGININANNLNVKRRNPPDAYVCAQLGRDDVDSNMADLLVRALDGWLSGPDVAAVAAADAARKSSAAMTPAAQVRRDSDGFVAVGSAGAERGNERAEGGGVGGKEEMVDWVDTEGRVICPLPRAVVHANNVLHRGAGVMIRNDEKEVYCHRRTATKRVFPSMYDMFIGGVSGSLEPSMETALRELGEELGLGPLGGSHDVDNAEAQHEESLQYRGECLVQTEKNRCMVSVFDYRVTPGETVRWQEEEVDWGGYLSWEEVKTKVSDGTWEFVPDGLQVWRHYVSWEASKLDSSTATGAVDEGVQRQ